jgi:hypothetical protein
MTFSALLVEIASSIRRSSRSATLPPARPALHEYRLQRVVRYGAAKSAELVGEKMRVRQVQDPHGIS